MLPKTSVTYRNEVLKKYKTEKGGEMSCYLLEPTRKQIKEACMWLLDRRNEKYDERILDRFFKFKDGENRLHAIDRVKGDKFKPIVNFLTGETKSTTPANLELIAWLINFKPRPLSMYLRSTPEHLADLKSVITNNTIESPLLSNHLEIPKNQVIQEDGKSITIISQINPSLKITTIVSL